LPPNCGAIRVRLTVGMRSVWARRGRMSAGRFFIAERVFRNGYGRKSATGGRLERAAIGQARPAMFYHANSVSRVRKPRKRGWKRRRASGSPHSVMPDGGQGNRASRGDRVMRAISIVDIGIEAAARLNLTRGRDNKWRGRCPACGYGKHTLEVAVEQDRIAVSCNACGNIADIAAAMGIPRDLVIAPSPRASNVARALDAWRRAMPAAGSLVETYLQGRGITCPPPASIRFLPRQRNWNDGKPYPAMIALVQRVPGADDYAALERCPSLIDAGTHFTFLQVSALDGNVRKAATDASKLTLGQLRHGGVWLTPVEEISKRLVVAEGIETALSVMQITKLPTVAALSAAGMRSLRWPPQVRRLWIAADNDQAGLKAAEVLLGRALCAGLQAHIRIPAGGKNDFNDLLRSA
jgi:Toprim domain